MWTFFIKYNGKCFGDLQQFEKLTDELHSQEILKKLRRSWICGENIVYNICNIQNMCESTICVIGKTSIQQQAISKVFRETEVIHRFLTAQGSVPLTSMLYKGQLYFITASDFTN